MVQLQVPKLDPQERRYRSQRLSSWPKQDRNELMTFSNSFKVFLTDCSSHLHFYILSFIPVKTTVYGYKSSGKEIIVNASLLNSENGANKCTLALWSQIFNFAAVWIKYVLYKGGTHGSKLLTKIVSQFQIIGSIYIQQLRLSYMCN